MQIIYWHMLLNDDIVNCITYLLVYICIYLSYNQLYNHILIVLVHQLRFEVELFLLMILIRRFEHHVWIVLVNLVLYILDFSCMRIWYNMLNYILQTESHIFGCKIWRQIIITAMLHKYFSSFKKNDKANTCTNTYSW